MLPRRIHVGTDRVQVVRGWPALLLTILLLAPAGADQHALRPFWGQLGGGPHHANVAEAVGELDVQASFRTIEEGETLSEAYAAAVIETQHGLATLAIDATSRTCTLVMTPLETLVPRRLAPVPCAHPGESSEGSVVVGYDAPRDRVLVCLAADLDDPVFAALDASTGQVEWSVTPRDLGATVPGSGAFGTALGRGVGGAGWWYCNNPGIDTARDLVVIPLAAIQTNTIGTVRLSEGTVLWTARLPAGTLGDDRVPFLAPASENLSRVAPGELGASAFLATLTETGIVIAGRWDQSGATHMGAAWYDLEGNPVGHRLEPVRPQTDDPTQVVNSATSFVAHAALAAGILYGQLLVIDPLQPTPTAQSVDTPLTDFSTTFEMAYSLALYDSILIVPFPTYVAAYDLNSAEQIWNWRDAAGSRPADVLVLPPDEVLILGAIESNPKQPAFFRHSLKEDTLLQATPLPDAVVQGAPPFSDPYTARFTPLRDGRIVLIDHAGNATLLGPATAPAPVLRLGDATPAPGVPMQVEVEGIPADAALVFGWGDGTVERIDEVGSAQHSYLEKRERTLRVTAVYPDGRTATATARIDVGGTELTALQQAFAPGYQEYTLFLLGLAITLLGALFAVLSRRRRHSRIAEDLAILDRIRRQAASDTVRAVEELGAFRARIADDLARGRIDDAQFSTLELAATRLLHLLRQRLLGSLAGRVSVRLEQALDLALQDGRVEASEEATLRALISGESQLATSEREVLERLVATWRARSSA